MKKNIETQLRWDVRTDTAEQEALRYKWVILIINRTFQIKTIKDRLFRQLAPVGEEDYYEPYEAPVEGTKDIYCLVMSFSSQNSGFQNSKQIYSSKSFYRDENLSRIRTELGWAKYVSGLTK